MTTTTEINTAPKPAAAAGPDCAPPTGSTFERENRYIVIKRSDARRFISADRLESLECLGDEIERARVRAGKAPLQCVVVEADWPEYEPTWRAIEERMSSSPAELARRIPLYGTDGD